MSKRPGLQARQGLLDWLGRKGRLSREDPYSGRLQHKPCLRQNDTTRCSRLSQYRRLSQFHSVLVCPSLQFAALIRQHGFPLARFHLQATIDPIDRLWLQP